MNGCLVEERAYTTISKDEIDLIFVSAAVLRPRGNVHRLSMKDVAHVLPSLSRLNCFEHFTQALLTH